MITSSSNAQIKNVINLIKKSRERKKAGLFVVEGRRMFEETPKERLYKVFVTEEFLKNNKDLMRIYEYETVSEEVFSHMTDTATPQGILALVRMKESTIDDIVSARDNPLILVLENLQDPGNLGTIIRTAEGAGVDGIIMSSDTLDIHNPKVIRSTMGAMYRMKFVYVNNILDTVQMLKDNGVNIYAAHLEGAVDYVKPDYTAATAFLIGNEGNGLTGELTALANTRIIIPMEGRLESLNAAVSSAILTYEAYRQRR